MKIELSMSVCCETDGVAIMESDHSTNGNGKGTVTTEVTALYWRAAFGIRKSTSDSRAVKDHLSSGATQLVAYSCVVTVASCSMNGYYFSYNELKLLHELI